MTKLEFSKISPYQFMFSVACYMQASILLGSTFIPLLKQDTWMAVLFAGIICIPFLIVFLTLSKRFPGLNLFQIHNEVFGPVIGRIISGIFILYFLVLASLNLSDFNAFINTTILPKTPNIVIVGSFMIVCAWAVRNGIEIIVRYAGVFTFASILLLVLTVLFTSDLINPRHLLPMFQQPLKNYVQATNTSLAANFSELVLVLMVFPSVNTDKTGKFLFLGYTIGFLTIFLTMISDISVLGSTVGLFSKPSYEVIRMITVSETISRLEIIFSAAIILRFYFRISMIYYVLTLAIAQFFNLKSYRPIVLVTGMLIITNMYPLQASSVVSQSWTRNSRAILWMFVDFGLPLLTLIIALIRKKKLPLPEGST